MEVERIFEINFLTEEEKQALSQPILEKITCQWKTKVEEIGALQAEIEKCHTDSEQQKFHIEKTLVDLRSKLEEEGKLKEEAQSQLASVKEKFSSQEENFQKENERCKSLLQQLEECRSAQENASAQCTSLAGNLESKEKLNEVLKGQIQNLEEQLAAVQRSKCDAMIQGEEAMTLKMKMQYKEHRFEQEKSLLTRQVELLQQQLEQRSEEVICMRRDHSNSIISLQSDCNHATEEASLLREEKEANQKILEEKTQKIEELLKSLSETRESETRLENSFRKELAAQEKLTNLYKQSGEDQKKRCEELEKGVEELRQLLQEASEQYGGLEKAKARAEEEAQSSLDQRDLLIKDLKEELQKVNEMLKNTSRRDDCLSELSPAAAAASQLMSKGLTLTQLYSEYLNTSEKLFQAEEENKRITRYLEQILKEIEEKAPILRKQREDYERALETINTLHIQMDSSNEEVEKQRLEAEEARRRSNFLGRENDHLNQQVKDLSKQVTVLLTQVEAARAGLPPPPLSVMENIPDGTSASDVIGQHLVAFRDVSELQEKNCKLLASLRDLTEKVESAEKTAIATKTQQLQDELETAQRELNELKTQRERMQATVENITRQRDMYRTLINQQSTKSSSPISGQGLTQASSQEFEKLKRELEAAQLEIDKMKKEHEDYRQERAKNDQMEKSEIERLRSFSEKTRNENIKLLSQVEYDQERLKTLHNNCNAYQRQVNALEEKGTTLQGIIGRHEATIESLREHVLSLTKKLSQAEVMAMNLREEKAMLKESEARLLAERDSLHRSQYSQSLLHSSLEAIKNNLEKNDSESRMRYENQISDLTEQCSRLRAKIESNMDLKEAKAKSESLEEQLKNAKDELNGLKKSLSEGEEQISSLKAQIQEAQQSKSSFKVTSPVLSRVRAPSPQTLTAPRAGAISNTVRELQVQLSEERAKTTALQASLEQAQASTANLKKLVEQQDSQIKESTETNKAGQDEITSLRKSLEETQAQIKELEEKLKAAVESEKALKETMDGQLLRMTEDLEERENELEEVQKKLEVASASEEKTMTQFREQSKIAMDMQDKYEREVMLHGADLKALASLKEKLTDHNSKIEGLTAAKLKAEEMQKELQAGFQEREEALKKTSEAMNSRIEELEAQNKTLLDQFTQLSDKMSAIQTKLATPPGEGGNTSFSEDEARSSDQLREVIRYLRREQEVIAGKVEVAQAEALRFEAQKKSLESQVELLHKYLATEKEKNQASVESAGKYGELMRKVHSMDALADSNRLLREEKDQQKTASEEAKAKVQSLEAQITPLQEKQRQLKADLDCVTADKKSLENERDLYKKRSQELVEKLNKARPEDLIKLQQELNSLQKTCQGKDMEINRLKNMVNHMQKNHQAITANKNQIQQQLQHSRGEVRKFTEENKKLSIEKMRLQQQSMQSSEKIQMLEATAHQNLTSQQQEQARVREQRTQMIQQLTDVRQKEEVARKEGESHKKTLEAKEAQLKEIESKLLASMTKIELLNKQTNQLRRIANKYKQKAGASIDAGESSNTTADEDLARETEEGKVLRQTDAGKKDEMEKLTEQNAKLNEEVQKKDAELAKIKSQDDGTVAKLQNELDTKNRELQKLTTEYSQINEKFTSHLAELKSTIEEIQSKKAVYESRISMLERERELYMQRNEALNSKITMQQKLLDNLQKQTQSVAKVGGSVISAEKPTESPPTANIKPMAAPLPTPAASSPRSQGTSQGSGSRSIPTASIRPMAPTSTPTGQSSVGVVPPLETHSGDAAVSSTVTLPQATVTPTPVAQASTTTQSFLPSLTATVQPVSQVTSAAPFAPATSGTADALISQAIALVAPQVEERMGGHKRKLEVEDEEEEEDAKRSRLQEEAQAMEDEQEEEEEEQQPPEEDIGEPSSSSSPPVERKVEEELLIVSSDEEGQVPSSQTGREDNEEETEEGGNREAEAERRDGGQVPSFTPSSSIHPPPRPLHEPPSSSRQSLAPFHQLPQYEEGVDDRIVPSTPTLFVPRTCESGASDGVSSPQVPSRGFEFGSSNEEGSVEVAAPSNEGLSQIAEGGHLDATRMDLAQLDESTRRSIPSTPIRRSPAVEATPEGNITSSGGDAPPHDMEEQGSPVPTGSMEEPFPHLEPDSGVEVQREEEGVVEVGEGQMEDEGDGENVVSSLGEEAEEGIAPQEEEQQEEEEEELPEEQQESGNEVEEEAEDEELEEEEQAPPSRGTRSSATVQPVQSRRIIPITWNEGGASRPPRSPIRGSRSPVTGRGAMPGAQRYQSPRGTQRARRSRPGRGTLN